MSGLKDCEGLSSAPLVRVDDPPLFSNATLLVAVTKQYFRWYPLRAQNGLLAAFNDVTEEIPANDRQCAKCGGSGEEIRRDEKGKVADAVQCDECNGYGHFSKDGRTEARRTVTWIFLADVPAEIEGLKLSPGSLWERLADDAAALAKPNSEIGVLAKALRISPEPAKPSVRISRLREELLARLVPGSRNHIVIGEIIERYRNFCRMLQSTAPVDVGGGVMAQPLIRHILIKQGRDKAYIPFHWPKEKQDEQLRKFGMA